MLTIITFYNEESFRLELTKDYQNCEYEEEVHYEYKDTTLLCQRILEEVRNLNFQGKQH